MIKQLLLVTLAVMFYTHTNAQNKRLLIENVTVIPMNVNQTFKNKDVIISDGRISNIRTHIENDTTNYDLGRIDGEGKFLTPSFSDAHAHLPEKQYLENYFLLNLANGVTTLRSMRGEKWHLDIDKTDALSPRLILGSPSISRGDSITKQNAKKLIAEYKEEGFDFIKILSVKDKKTFDYLAESAKENSFHLAGHCPSNVGIFDVCESQVFQSIEHLGGFFQLPDIKSIDSAINQSIHSSIYHCATLDWNHSSTLTDEDLRQRKGVDYIPQQLINEWETQLSESNSKTDKEKQEADRKMFENQFNYRLNYLGYIYRQGAFLLISPDASGTYSIPGFAMQTEMQHYSKAGISNFDILKAACFNLAEMLNQEQEWGAIKLGASTDLVLLNANPLDDIKHAEEVEGVVLKGNYYSQKELLDKVKK